jgi:hypothetical protein
VPILNLIVTCSGILILQVFFGTPHRGSTVADFGAVLNSVARFLDRRDLLSSLSRDNQALLDISQDFIALVGSAGYSIKSFYEENKTAGIRLVAHSPRKLLG